MNYLKREQFDSCCKIFLVFMLITITLLVSSHSPFVEDFSEGKIVVQKKIRRGSSFILYIKYKGTNYILKQKINPLLNVWCIAQALLADIFAHSVDTISSQRVKIIPEHVVFPGKIQQNMPTSLHTIVPGKSVKTWNKTFNRLRLLITRNIKTKKMLQRFDIKVEFGLRPYILQCISVHDDLPAIVALHLLLGFYDGHRGNIFYDRVTDRFSIIDMDSSFKMNLAKQAYIFLKQYIQNHYISPGIKKALFKMADTLELLMERNDIETITSLGTQIFDVLIPDKNDGDRIDRLAQIEKFLKESYSSAYLLINCIRNSEYVHDSI
jgi:hypothetical protein